MYLPSFLQHEELTPHWGNTWSVEYHFQQQRAKITYKNMHVDLVSGLLQNTPSRNKFNKWSERVLNLGSPNLKANAPTTGLHCNIASG